MRSPDSIGLSTGFRIHEILGMSVGHVATGRPGSPELQLRADLTVERHGLKFGRSAKASRIRARRVPLTARLRQLLGDYLHERFQFHFWSTELGARPLLPSRKGSGPLRRWQAAKIVRNACRGAGLDPAQPWGTHSLRKCFARLVYEESGHDIDLTRVALGHSSVTTTQRYLATSESAAFDAIGRIQAAAGQPMRVVPTTGVFFIRAG